MRLITIIINLSICKNQLAQLKDYMICKAHHVFQEPKMSPRLFVFNVEDKEKIENTSSRHLWKCAESVFYTTNGIAVSLA